VIPVSEIAENAAVAWLHANLHALDVHRHVRIHPLERPGSTALSALVAPGQTSWVAANDTSFAVGHAPPSRLERVVLAVERALTSSSTIAAHPVIGEDVKVMGLRRGHRIDLTVACAMVDCYVRGPQDYAEAKALVTQVAEQAVRDTHTHHVHVAVNTADDVAAGRMYLTVTGTSAEAGDDGQTGRGNRVGGLITPCRPMTLEATAGKNVVSHVGKSYGVVAHRIAQELVATCPEIAEATCVLVSRIGWPIETPQMVELQIQTRNGVALETVRGAAEATARNCLRGLPDLTQQLLDHASIESPAEWPGVLLF
jgi:S-adenosylmethionine synthetase